MSSLTFSDISKLIWLDLPGIVTVKVARPKEFSADPLAPEKTLVEVCLGLLGKSPRKVDFLSSEALAPVSKSRSTIFPSSLALTLGRSSPE